MSRAFSSARKVRGPRANACTGTLKLCFLSLILLLGKFPASLVAFKLVDFFFPVYRTTGNTTCEGIAGEQ